MIVLTKESAYNLLINLSVQPHMCTPLHFISGISCTSHGVVVEMDFDQGLRKHFQDLDVFVFFFSLIIINLSLSYIPGDNLCGYRFLATFCLTFNSQHIILIVEIVICLVVFKKDRHNIILYSYNIRILLTMNS